MVGGMTRSRLPDSVIKASISSTNSGLPAAAAWTRSRSRASISVAAGRSWSMSAAVSAGSSGSSSKALVPGLPLLPAGPGRQSGWPRRGCSP